MDTTNGHPMKVEPVFEDCESALHSLRTAPEDQNLKLDIDEMDMHLLEPKEETGEIANAYSAGKTIPSETKTKTISGDPYFKLHSREKFIVGRALSTKSKRKCKEFSDITLLRCIACDKTFKGGKRRVPCLINHVKMDHCRQQKKLLSLIARYTGENVSC